MAGVLNHAEPTEETQYIVGQTLPDAREASHAIHIIRVAVLGVTALVFRHGQVIGLVRAAFRSVRNTDEPVGFELAPIEAGAEDQGHLLEHGAAALGLEKPPAERRNRYGLVFHTPVNDRFDRKWQAINDRCNPSGRPLCSLFG